MAERDTTPGHGPWSREDMLLADMKDQLRWLEYAVYVSQGGKPSKPDPTPRPGVPATDKLGQVSALNPAGLAHLQALRRRGRE